MANTMSGLKLNFDFMCCKYWLGFGEYAPQEIMLEEELIEGNHEVDVDMGEIVSMTRGKIM